MRTSEQADKAQSGSLGSKLEQRVRDHRRLVSLACRDKADLPLHMSSHLLSAVSSAVAAQA